MMISSSSAWGNQTLKLALDSRQSDDEEDNDSNIDTIKKAGLSSIIKIDNEDDDEQNNNSIFIQFYVFINNLLIIIRRPNSLEK